MMKDIWQLFLMFSRIGAFTFGGGYAMLPILQRELVEEKKWVSEEELIDYYAIGQSTPGIIAINTATMVGYTRRGIPGAIAATLGMVFPSLVIITLIASFFQRFREYPLVQHAFAGIQIGVVALILNVIVKMWRSSIKDYFGIVIFLLGFLVLAFLEVSPIIVIISSALIGIIVQNSREKRISSKNGDK